MTALRDTLEEIDVMRSMFKHCFYCDGDLSALQLRELVVVAGRQRLAHRECPSGETPNAA